MKQIIFLTCFLAENSSLFIKNIEENDSSSSTDLCPGCGQPQTVHTAAKVTKVKDLALIFNFFYRYHFQ